MKMSRFGQLLLVIGGAVGATAVVGLVIGFEPAKLPPALLNIAVYKLTFAAAAGLLAAGAIVHRYSKRDARPGANESASSVGAPTNRNALGEGAAGDQLPATSAKRASDTHEVR